jgi:hypothetical protein
MTKTEEPKALPPMFADERILAWMEEHAAELRQSVEGQSLLHTSLLIGFLVGLAAHIGGYALLSSVPTGALGLLADLLYALGWSLWTGVVVAVFIQVVPEAKRRQIRRAVDAYEALKRDGEPAHSQKQHRDRG